MSGSLVDFGLYFFHNAKAALAQGSGPYFYLPKMESHLEARLQNDVFVLAQERLGVANGSIKALVPDRDRCPRRSRWTRSSTNCATTLAGLNCGRWDYIFLYIKRLRRHPEALTPDPGW